MDNSFNFKFNFKSDKNRYFWVIISALIQGLLLGVYAIVPTGIVRCMPLTIIFLVPLAFWLSQEHLASPRRLLHFLFWLTFILAILWLYRLWSFNSFVVVPSQNSEFIRVAIVVFLTIPFFQCFSLGRVELGNSVQ